MFDSYDFRQSIPDVPVFDSILHDFQSVLVYISTAVCYSITGFHFRHEASCYPVKEMLDNYNTYFIWYEYNIRAGDCLKIFVHCTLI